MNAPIKHHWWPQSFQQPWANESGLVTRILKSNGKLVWKSIGPKGIAFEKGLYSVNWDGFDDPQFVESSFFAKAIDEPAAKVLAKLINGNVDDITTGEKSVFAGFLILSYFRRADVLGPAQDALEKKSKAILAAAADSEDVYLKNRKKGETKDQFFSRFAAVQRDILLKDLINLTVELPSKDRSYYKRIKELTWKVIDVSNSDLELLSCDKPITLGLGFEEEDEIILPISPNKIFQADTKTGPTKIDGFSRSNARKLVRSLNTLTCQSAKNFILARRLGPNQEVLKFIDKHFNPET